MADGEIEIVRDHVTRSRLTEIASEGFGDVWGINLYPAEFGADGWLEFDSMINIRPTHGNRSRAVEDRSTQDRIRQVVDRLVRDA